MKLFVLYYDEPDYVSDHYAAVDSVIEAPDLKTAEKFAKHRGHWLHVREVATVNCPYVKIDAGMKVKDMDKRYDEAILAARRSV